MSGRKLRDDEAIYFCTTKFNAFSRFVSIATVKGLKSPLLLLFQNQHWVLVVTSQQIKLKILFREETTLRQSLLPNNWTRPTLKLLTEIDGQWDKALSRWIQVKGTPSKPRLADSRIKRLWANACWAISNARRSQTIESCADGLKANAAAT